MEPNSSKTANLPECILFILSKEPPTRNPSSKTSIEYTGPFAPCPLISVKKSYDSSSKITTFAKLGGTIIASPLAFVNRTLKASAPSFSRSLIMGISIY